jgi:uncharacterized protein
MMSTFLPRHPFARLSAVLVLILLVTAPWGLTWLRMDNGIEQWVADDVTDVLRAKFERDFGGEDFLLLAYEGGPLFDEDSLDVQLEVLRALEAIPAVSTVQSLPSLFRDHFGSESGEELEAEIESSPFYDNVIIAVDRRMAGMIVGSRQTFSALARRDYVAAVRQAAAPLHTAGWSVYLVGPNVLNAALDTVSEAESRRLLPIAVIAACLLLCILLRSLKKMAIVATVSAVSLILTLGLMGWLDLTMNMVTVALPPVLWVLSSAYTVHLLRYYDRALEEGREPTAAIERAVGLATRPSILAAITTALGFLALRTATVVPVQELGLAAALGIPLALLVTFGVAPPLIRLLCPRLPAMGVRGITGVLSSGLHPHAARPILIATVLISGICAFLTTRVGIESNPLTFLDPALPIARDSAVVAERFTGLYTLETAIQLPGSWLNPAVWPLIESQALALAAEPGVSRVLSPLDYLKKMNQWSKGGALKDYHVPRDRAAAEALIADAPDTDLAPLRALVSPDDTRVRLSSLVHVMDGGKLLNIVSASEAALEEHGASGIHTGVVLRLVQAQFALIETQLRSLGIAVLVIFGCVAVGLRSWRLLLLSIAPNLAPVLALFGIMGLAGVPLDPATVMVAAMTLGIAVDDSMHLLVTWQEQRRVTGDGAASLREAVRLNGPAMVTTTSMACAGFLTLGLSDFAPIRYFGLLSAAAMAVALAADLWLLPALIQMTTPRETETP